jgi:hypothetical protein
VTQNGTRATRVRASAGTECATVVEAGRYRVSSKECNTTTTQVHEYLGGWVLTKAGRGKGGVEGGWKGRREGGKGRERERPGRERRSQDVLQALASVRDHKFEIHNAAQAASKVSCVCVCVCVSAQVAAGERARPCGTLRREAAGPYRCCVLRAACCGGLGARLLLPFDWVPFFCFFLLTLPSPRLPCTSLLWATAASFTRSPLPRQTRSWSPPSSPPPQPPPFRSEDEQTGGWHAMAKGARCYSRYVSWSPSGCPMHDSVATASATGHWIGRKTAGPQRASLVTDGLGPGKVGSRSCCIRLPTGPGLGRLWIGCSRARGIRE